MIKKSLLALMLGGLAIGMTEFTMMGLLEEFARDLNISIPSAGHYISIYALGVVIGAPLLVVLTSKMAPKKILMLFMLMFTVFNGLFVFAPDNNTLLLARFMAGLPHGAYFGVGAVVASQLATKGKEAQAIATMFTGLTLANLIGVPIGTFIGQHFSWRVTFFIISLFGLITMYATHKWIPNLAPKSNMSMRHQLSFFARKEAWLLIAIISIGTGGLFAWISYIAPLMTQETGISERHVPFIMILVGLGMLMGNIFGGRLADRVAPTKAAIAAFISMAVCLLLVYLSAGNIVLAYVMSLVTGFGAFIISAPLQMMLIGNAHGSETIAAATGQACFNIGNALGAFLGGLPMVFGLSFKAPSLVGMLMALCGAGLSVWFLKMMAKRPTAL